MRMQMIIQSRPIKTKFSFHFFHRKLPRKRFIEGIAFKDLQAPFLRPGIKRFKKFFAISPIITNVTNETRSKVWQAFKTFNKISWTVGVASFRTTIVEGNDQVP